MTAWMIALTHLMLGDPKDSSVGALRLAWEMEDVRDSAASLFSIVSWLDPLALLVGHSSGAKPD
jgi:hypothetical protein